MALAPGASLQYFSGVAMHASERLTLALCNADGRVAWLVPELEVQSLTEAGVLEATSSTTAWRSYKDNEEPTLALRELLRDFGIDASSRVGVESGRLRLFEARALVDGSQCEAVAADAVTAATRLYKSVGEIARIKAATKIVDEALKRMLPAMKPGITEYDVAAELEYQMRKLGSERTPFGTIVASGPRGALPHGAVTDRRLALGDLVVLDYGAVVDGYAADTTRTVALGEPGEKARAVYKTVLAAQLRAIEAVLPGAPLSAVDRAARDVIEAAGYGHYFTHRTGHGLGLDVHEFPSVADGVDLAIGAGMVFTIEPGVYIPGEFGVRIEDDIAVTADEVLVLTEFPKELVIL